MDREQKKNRAKILEITKEVKKEFTDSICMVPNCKEKAIISHSIPKKNLRYIAPDGEFYCLKADPFSSYKFYPQGINKVGPLADYCFCSQHDNSLFSEIEKDNCVDPENSNHLHLILYRSICLILRREQRLYRKLEKICSLPEVIYGLWNSNYYNEQLTQTNHIIDHLTSYASSFFRKVIENDAHENLSPSALIIPNPEVSAIGLFEIENDFELHMMRQIAQNFGGNLHQNTLEIFFVLFPINQKQSLVILARPSKGTIDIFSEHYLNNLINDFKSGNLKIRLSEILTDKIDTWVCSNQIYKSKIKLVEKKIFKRKKESIVSSSIPINILS